MKRSRLIFVFVFLFALLIGGLAPISAVRASDDSQFTAASTVLKQSGKVGPWMFPDAPGFPPVKCTYYPNGQNPNGIPVSLISPYAPVVFAVPNLGSQTAEVIYRLNQRWPDGSLHAIAEKHLFSPVNQNPTSFGGGGFYTYDRGSTFVVTVEIIWSFVGTEVGRVELLYTQYQSNINLSPGLPVTNACKPLYAATAVLGNSEGTVGSSIPFKIDYFPTDPSVGIYFDGQKIGTVATDAWGTANGSFVVPAAPMGKHTIKFYRLGRTVSKTFAIKPRIKLIPSSGIDRGQTVNVSLRGYAKYETVSIRWKKGTSWVQVGQVKTSSTGSANISVKVPTFVPNGSTSVRGDGQYGHAQTNAVTVSGGSPLTSSTVKPTPSPTPVATQTPPSTPTSAPESTPEPTSTAVPTEQPATPGPAVTETAPAEPTESTTPVAEPTEEASAPTETPTIESTAIPSESLEPSVTEESA
jgi:hypothetical protein